MKSDFDLIQWLSVHQSVHSEDHTREKEGTFAPNTLCKPTEVIQRSVELYSMNLDKSWILGIGV